MAERLRKGVASVLACDERNLAVCLSPLRVFPQRDCRKHRKPQVLAGLLGRLERGIKRFQRVHGGDAEHKTHQRSQQRVEECSWLDWGRWRCSLIYDTEVSNDGRFRDPCFLQFFG